MSDRVKDIIKKLKEENKVLPVTTDCIFKDIFRDDEMKGVLAYLISNIVDLNYSYVVNNLRFKNTELINEKSLEKRKTTDLIVDISDMVINLEMNSSDNTELRIKNNMYHHTLAARQLKKGEAYKNSKKIIQINFEKIRKFDDRIVIKFTMRDSEGKYEIDENYINYHINLAKVYEKYYNKEKLNRFEKILLIMMLEEKESLIEISKGDEELEIMVRKIFYESEDPDVIGVYDKEEMNKWLMDVSKSLGKEAKSLEIAKKMLNDNIDVEIISKYTGLTKEEIENIGK